MTDPKPAPAVLQIVLGRRLAALRSAAGMTAADAGRAIRTAATTITRMEKAEVGLNPAKVKWLLEIYGVGPSGIQEFLDLLDKASDPGWWQGFRDALPSWFGVHVSLETAAAHIHSYEPAVVHGLLQTEDYARGVLSRGLPRMDPDTLERRVHLRVKRQELLTRSDPAPPRLWVVMDETNLRRPVGGPEVMTAQLDHLLTMAELPNVSIRICPFERGLHSGGFGPFTVFRFEIPELPDIVSGDTLSRAVYSEEKSEVALFREALDQMSATALSGDDTRQFICDIRKELYP
ncbi:helix-turn-helix transcriptional regulator [Streptomyces sp. NPDC026672]|uniref:helix-turn-helix domain-containing protein n=1 Tax=unclassified Streptomyces TaxID=2593676 RepID=UPI0034048367